jgi:hypothetical protein
MKRTFFTEKKKNMSDYKCVATTLENNRKRERKKANEKITE